MAIDRAVLLPGQELMERMDHEYNGTGRAEDEKKVRRDEGGSQAENEVEGQDPEQNTETAEKIHQSKSEEAGATIA